MPELFSTPEPANNPRHPSPFIFTVIALLIALIAVGLGVYNANQKPAVVTDTMQLAQQLSTMQSQLQSVQQTVLENQRSAQNEINQLRQAISDAEKNKTSLQTEQRYAEVAYLTHIAETRLRLAHDREGALAALSLAQSIVTNHPELKTLEEAVNENISVLQKIPAVDIASLFTQLSNMINQVQQLSTLPTPPAAATTNNAADTQQTWHQKILSFLSPIKKLFVIRHVESKNTTILASTEEQYVKEEIMMQLTLAQWALLHHDQTIFNETLKNAQTKATQYFSSSENASLLEAIAKLQAINIDPSLPSLNTLLRALP